MIASDGLVYFDHVHLAPNEMPMQSTFLIFFIVFLQQAEMIPSF
jgi:hypothetical protein